MTPKRYRRFSDFYPFYLSQHRHPLCRLLHYTGSMLVVGLLVVALWQKDYLLLWYLPLVGYGFAWLGHFIFEKNRPATFRYPWYSFLGDWLMLWQALRGRLPRH